MPSGKRYQRSEEDRAVIADMLAAGEKLPAIAKRLGITPWTIREHYRSELRNAGVRRGRPDYVPNEEDRGRVESMAALGLSHADICKVMKISVDTLEEHFPEELDVGAIKANALVGRALFRAATDWLKKPGAVPDKMSVTAAIFWAKTRLNWKETERHEMTGADGAPLPASIAVTFVDPSGPDGPELPEIEGSASDADEEEG